MLQKNLMGGKKWSLSLSVPQSPFTKKKKKKAPKPTIKQIQTKIGAFKQINTKSEQVWRQKWC